jgi:hypothetical protein
MGATGIRGPGSFSTPDIFPSPPAVHAGIGEVAELGRVFLKIPFKHKTNASATGSQFL